MTTPTLADPLELLLSRSLHGEALQAESDWEAAQAAFLTDAGNVRWNSLKDAHRPRFRRILSATLLERGGHEVAWEDDLLPLTDPDLLGDGQYMPFAFDEALLVTQGQFHTASIVRMTGQPCACHHNVARLFYDRTDADPQPRRLDIMTGYGLGTDGVWRRHSWAVPRHAPPLIIETTEPRSAYFGVRLDAREYGAEQVPPGLMAWPFCTLNL